MSSGVDGACAAVAAATAIVTVMAEERNTRLRAYQPRSVLGWPANGGVPHAHDTHVARGGPVAVRARDRPGGSPAGEQGTGGGHPQPVADRLDGGVRRGHHA